MTMPQTTTDSKPLYAVAGLADLAVEKLRALPARVPAFTERAESAATNVRAKLSELPADVQKLRAELPADVQKLRDDVPTFLHNAQTKLVRFSGEVADAYEGLSERGESAVKRFRNERAGELETVTVKVADAADKAADAAGKMADELKDEPEAKPAPKAQTSKPKTTKAESPKA